MANNNILITGVNGFIGKNICNFLTKKKYNVYGIDNFYSSSEDTLDLIKSNFFFFREKSILEEDIFDISPFKIDTVIHLAAQTSVIKSIEDPKENDEINIKGFKNILDLSKKNKVKNFFFASSCAVYGDCKILPNHENIKNLKPTSPYALSKLNNEKYSMHPSFNQMFIVGLRLYNIYGPMQNYSSEYSAIISKWTDSMKNSLQCKIYGDGKAVRDFCYIGDLCELFEILIENCKSSGIYNFSTNKPCEIEKLFFVLIEIFDKKGFNVKFKRPIFLDERKGEIKVSYGDNTMLKSDFGFSPKIDLKTGLNKLLHLQW